MLVAPEVTADLLLPTCILLPVLGVLDTTLFLAARSEHYFLVFASLFVCFDDGVWIAAATAALVISTVATPLAWYVATPLWLLTSALVLLLGVPAVRRRYVTEPLLRQFRKVMPPM